MGATLRYSKARDYAFGMATLTLREKAHLTQEEVAKQVGVSIRALQKWEGGSSYPIGSSLRKLIETYLLHNAFTPGQETQEAEELWELARQRAPRPRSLFDQRWFQNLLQQQSSSAPLSAQSFIATAQEDTITTAPDAATLSDYSKFKGSDATGTPSSSLPALVRWEDQGEAIDVHAFYGRQAEQALLRTWIMTDRCRVVALLGLGGIGKTVLSIKLSQQFEESFEIVLWRSLRNAPPLEELLADWLATLSGQSFAQLPQGLENRLARLIVLLRQRRCLLILDNFEALFQRGSRTGRYRESYEAYGRLLQRIGEAEHQSCLVITSQEKPKELGPLEGSDTPVRSLKLSGLSLLESQELLRGKELLGSPTDWQELVQRYGGNPFALKMIAETIRDIFGGEIAAFLREGITLFSGLQEILAQHFERLSQEEQAVMYWLGCEREVVSLEMLAADMAPVLSRKQVLEALEALWRRSLIERGSKGASFTLQAVVLEYVTERIVEQMGEELLQGSPALLRSHALMRAQGKEYVRHSQIRFLLHPLLEKVLPNSLDAQEAEKRLAQMLTLLRTMPFAEQGYGGGNLVNLLVLLKGELRGYDLSGLAIKRAYLQGVELQDVNLSDSYLTDCVFTDAFDAIFCVAFSPDGNYAAAGCANGEVRIWRVKDWQPYMTLRGHVDWVWSIAFSPDGRLLASSSEDRTVRLWDASNGSCLATLQERAGKSWSVAFSPTGNVLATGDMDQTIKLWDVTSGQCLRVLQGHTGWVMSVAFSPDGSFLVSGSADQSVKLWDISNGECLNTLRGHMGIIWAVALSPDGTLLASGGEDQTVKLWDVRTGQCLNTLQGHKDWLQSLCFSPDGRLLVSGSEDRTARLWEINSGACLRIFYGHTNIVWSVIFSPDGNTMASGSMDQSMKVWEVSSGRCLKTLQGHAASIWSADFNPDGTVLVSGGSDQLVRLWDVNSGRGLKALQGHNGLVYATAFSPDRATFASGGADQTVRLWSTQDGRPLKTLHAHTRWVCSVAFNFDGSLLASGGADQTVRIWSPANGQCLHTLNGHINWIWSVAFSPDGRLLASGSADSTIRIWNTGNGKCMDELQGHTNWIWSVAFSPDGRLLASGSADSTIKIWEVASGQSHQTLRDHTGVVFSVAFSPDGSMLASSSEDHMVRIWDVASWQCLRILRGHVGRIRSVAFNSDGSLLASASDDGTIKLWSVSTGACLKTLKSDRPYERMNMSGITGITKAQEAMLRALGAVEGSAWMRHEQT